MRRQHEERVKGRQKHIATSLMKFVRSSRPTAADLVTQGGGLAGRMGDNPFEADDDDNPFADKGAADDYNPFDDSMFDKKVQRLPLFSSFPRPSLCGRHTHSFSQSLSFETLPNSNDHFPSPCAPTIS